MGIGTKTVWRCDVCKHEWLSRDKDKPLRCANCKTPYWDKRKKSGLEQVKESLKNKRGRNASYR